MDRMKRPKKYVTIKGWVTLNNVGKISQIIYDEPRPHTVQNTTKWFPIKIIVEAKHIKC